MQLHGKNSKKFRKLNVQPREVETIPGNESRLLYLCAHYSRNNKFRDVTYKWYFHFKYTSTVSRKDFLMLSCSMKLPGYKSSLGAF